MKTLSRNRFNLLLEYIEFYSLANFICGTVIWRGGWRIATFTFLFYLSKFLLSGWFCEKCQL